MDQYKTVTATEIKNSLGTYLADVHASAEPLVIERHGRPFAVLVSWDGWQEATGQRPQPIAAWLEFCRKQTEKYRANPPKQRGPSAVEMVRALRDEER